MSIKTNEMQLAYIIIFSLLIPVLFRVNGSKFRLKSGNLRVDIYFLVVASVLFYLQFALRSSSVGSDTQNYFDLFQNIKELNYSGVCNYVTRMEIGYLFYNRIISDLCSNPQSLLVVSGLFIITANSYFIYKYSQQIWLSLFLFFTLRYFDTNMNILRQALALVCILYSYTFLRNRRFWPFLSLVGLGSLFHISAIVFIISWFTVKVRFKSSYIFWYILSLFGVYVLSSYLVDILFRFNIIYVYYADSDYLAGGKIAPMLNLFINLCIISIGISTKSYKVPVESKEKPRNFIYDNQNMLMLLLVSSYIQILGLSFALLERVAAYFQIFSIVFLPNSLKCIRRKEWYILSLFLVILVSIAYYLIIITYRPDWNKVYPYRFCF